MSWLERTELMFGTENLSKIKSAHILVVGLGGVGAYAAEMVARAGVGRMTIVDCDIVSESNINRQLIALHSTIGESKSMLMSKRLRDINPEIELDVVHEFLNEDNMDEILDKHRYDYVVDAIDTLAPKVALVERAFKRALKIVSSMGAGAKTDPTLIEIKDISKSHHCPLAHALRKRLNRLGIRKGITVVFSPEPVREGAMILCNERNKKSNLGTVSYMPAMFGCSCASAVIRGLIGEF